MRSSVIDVTAFTLPESVLDKRIQLFLHRADTCTASCRVHPVFLTYLLNLWKTPPFITAAYPHPPFPPAHMHLCTPELCVVSSCLTAKLVFTFFLLTKAFLSIIRAEAQLNSPQCERASSGLKGERGGWGAKKYSVEEWKLVPWIYNTRQKRCYCKRERGTPVA